MSRSGQTLNETLNLPLDAPPLVELTGVAKTYRSGLEAVAHLDLQVHQGEFLSLVGPSGCGKSTVLRMLSGLATVSRGTIHWPNENAERRVGYVFQEPTLLPWADVWRNVYLPLRLKGWSKARAKTSVDEALSLVGLSDFASARPRELSGGMKMRVSLARALVTKPELLLLDEPFAALDEITRFRLNDDLLRLWNEHHWTVVFVTHSVYESVFLSDRVLVMSARPGRIVDEIPVDGPTPRTAEFRHSSEFTDTCRQVSVALQTATDAST
ncbi:MAG: ABC transporter ATP-binding protein [Pirellulales bacterium]